MSFVFFKVQNYTKILFNYFEENDHDGIFFIGDLLAGKNTAWKFCCESFLESQNFQICACAHRLTVSVVPLHYLLQCVCVCVCVVHFVSVYMYMLLDDGSDWCDSATDGCHRNTVWQRSEELVP